MQIADRPYRLLVVRDRMTLQGRYATEGDAIAARPRYSKHYGDVILQRYDANNDTWHDLLCET